MRHLTEDELALYAFDPESTGDREGIEKHLADCADCTERLEFVRSVDRGLADPDAWEIVEEIEADFRIHDGRDGALGGSVPVRAVDSLFDLAGRVAKEDDEAQRLLEPLLARPARFVWANISQQRKFRTAGVVRALSRAASQACYDKPLLALTYADAAIAVAEALPTDAYPGNAVYDLRGTAWKDRANALRLLGKFPPALDALDHAERAFANVPTAPLGPAITMHLRAVILYERGELEQALRLARASADDFVRLGDTERYMNARHLEGNIRFHQQDIRVARQIYARILAYAEATNDLTWIAREARTLAHCDLELGDTAAAARYFHQALQAFAALQQHAEVTRTKWGIALLVLTAGKADDALARLQSVRADFKQLEMLTDEALVALDMMDALLKLGRPHDIAGIAVELVRRFTDAGMLTSALAAFAYLREASVAGTVTPQVVDHVRQFIRRAEQEPALLFAPPPTSR